MDVIVVSDPFQPYQSYLPYGSSPIDPPARTCTISTDGATTRRRGDGPW